MAAVGSLEQLCREAADAVMRGDGLATSVGLRSSRGALPELVGTAVSETNWSFDLLVDSKALTRLAGLGFNQAEGAAALRALVSAVCRAELGHWKYCPFDGRWLAAIVEGVAAGAAKESPKSDLGVLVRRLSGLFCDLVAWTCAAAWDQKVHRECFADALALRLLAIAASPPVPLDLAVVLCLQQWTVAGHHRSGVQTRARQALVRSLGAETGAVKNTVRRVAARLGLLARGHVARGSDAARVLGERSAWSAAAAAFGEEMARLPAPAARVLASADVTTMFARTPPSQQPTSRTPARGRSGAGGSLPEDLLSLVYRSRGEEVAWAFEQVGGVGKKPVDVGWAAVRRYREGERVSSSEVKLSATRVLSLADEPPVLWLYRRELPLSVTAAGRGRAARDLAWVVDSSQSMTWEPFATDDGGKFDRLLRTVFGVWRWLERRGLAMTMRHAVVNFSTRTICSGWHAWTERQLVERVLFQHQNGRTVLDRDSTLECLLSAGRPCVALFVTDGELDRRDDLRVVFEGLRAAGHVPVLIDVASTASTLSSTLRGAGFECHHIPDGHALSVLLLGAVLPRRVLG